jgi:hypothetical protein
MITAAYTICKNELKYVEKWLYYTKDFNYSVLLDTGSTDGTWEALQEAAKTDKNLIIEQKIFTPWRFDVARMHNLDMVPDEVEWALSPDMDEYFSINVLEEMDKMIEKYPNITNIATTRLDIYTKNVIVGPPFEMPTNKIHKRHDYKWVQPIYEHLWYKYDIADEVEKYSDRIYLVHDQDFKKKERPELYLKMLEEEFEANPSNCWTLWFLLGIYFKEQNLDKFIKGALVYIEHAHKDKRREEIIAVLTSIYNTVELDKETKETIKRALE